MDRGWTKINEMNVSVKSVVEREGEQAPIRDINLLQEKHWHPYEDEDDNGESQESRCLPRRLHAASLCQSRKQLASQGAAHLTTETPVYTQDEGSQETREPRRQNPQPQKQNSSETSMKEKFHIKGFDNQSWSTHKRQ